MMKIHRFKRYFSVPVHPKSITTWQDQQESGEDFLAQHSKQIGLNTHYQLLKELSNDINEFRAELRGFDSINDMKMYDISKRKREQRKKQLENE